MQQVSVGMSVIVWFRQDLRIWDNPALYHAVLSNQPILAIYIHEDDNTKNPWPILGAQQWWLHHSLISLKKSLSEKGFCKISIDQLKSAYQKFKPFFNDGKTHKNIDVIRELLNPLDSNGYHDADVVFTVIINAEDQAKSAEDAYLRLHMLSQRAVKPHGVNMNGVFGILPNNAWTNIGPIRIEDVDNFMFESRRNGTPFLVESVDRFPKLTDYVIPSGVRIANGARVRLGAHLGEGTGLLQERQNRLTGGAQDSARSTRTSVPSTCEATDPRRGGRGSDLRATR